MGLAFLSLMFQKIQLAKMSHSLRSKRQGCGVLRSFFFAAGQHQHRKRFNHTHHGTTFLNANEARPRARNGKINIDIKGSHCGMLEPSPPTPDAAEIACDVVRLNRRKASAGLANNTMRKKCVVNVPPSSATTAANRPQPQIQRHQRHRAPWTTPSTQSQETWAQLILRSTSTAIMLRTQPPVLGRKQLR